MNTFDAAVVTLGLEDFISEVVTGADTSSCSRSPLISSVLY